jgi:hypothetical protein
VYEINALTSHESTLKKSVTHFLQEHQETKRQINIFYKILRGHLIFMYDFEIE